MFSNLPEIIPVINGMMEARLGEMPLGSVYRMFEMQGSLEEVIGGYCGYSALRQCCLGLSCDWGVSSCGNRL